ncbi:hypothetical protein ASE93_17005 [Serratia sp. Leaf50]|nr:hypothetical protein ASE93_17005 [Serratia sp. Leaf50]
MTQQPRYLEDTYCFSIESEVVARGSDEHGEWIALKDNIFHPQGGGQPADIGWVNDIAVKVRRHASGLVALYPVQALEFVENEVLRAKVSPAERLRNSALHTAGHFLNFALYPYGWKGIAGHHFPGESRVEFSPIGPDALAVDALPLREIEEKMAARLRDGAEVKAWREGETRITLIENTEPILCGGTHLANINQIADLTIKSAKFKKGTLRVSYDAAYRD